MTTNTSSHPFANALPSEFASFTDRLAKLGEEYTTHRAHIPSVFAQLDDEEFADIARKIGMSPTDLTMLPPGSYSAGQLISDIVMAGPLGGTSTVTLATCAKVRSFTEAEGGALSWIFQFLLTSDRSDLQRLRTQRYLDGYLEFFQNRSEEPELLSQLGFSFSGRAPWLSALLKRFEAGTLADLLFCLDYSAEELGSCASDSAGRDLSDVLKFRFEAEPQAFKLDRFIVGAPVIDSAKKDALCSMLSGLNAQQGEALRWLLQFLIAAGFVDVAACESKWRNLDYIEGFVTGAQHAYSNTPEEVHVLD